MYATKALRLPLNFDVARLEQDLDRIEADEWVDHFNTAAYERRWSCVPLRSIGGRADHIVSTDGPGYEDTPILARCPYFREVIDSFRCDKTSVRLMALEAGGIIKEHVDFGTCFEDGIVRLHVPIRTTPEVVFIVEGEEIHFDAGATWYLNAGARHGVRNGSGIRRVHLMLDCISNAWLESMLGEAGFVTEPPPKYGDRSITDVNVDSVIAALRAMQTTAGAAMADRLARIRADT
ncbi:MAG: aspartyl/asparaginyl beta-hydroxylase domain-containing protein [Ignavibacteria bacterium]